MNGAIGTDCIAPLFVPGDRPDRFERAAESGADAVIVDLEDAVAPGAKAAARRAVRTDFTPLPVFVRINGAGTEWHEGDLAVINDLPVAGILLPKADASIDLDRVGARHSVFALVETARGIRDARLLAAHSKVTRLAFGSIDYCADLGCAHTRESLLAARCELVLASRLAELAAPLDGVTAAIEDLKQIEDDARHALELGLGGKLCIHPKQIRPVFLGMRPSEVEIAWAEQVSQTRGAEAVAGMMVDAPVRTRALSILARARRMTSESMQMKTPARATSAGS